MRYLKICLTLFLLLSLLSCVSKKKFNELESRIDELSEMVALTAYDDDNDGVSNAFDQEPDTPEGCPVDTRGMTLDSDMDGFPDCDDKEPFSPPGYPIDDNGVVVFPQKDEIVILGDDVEFNQPDIVHAPVVIEDNENECVLVSTYFATDRNLISAIDHPQLEFGTYRDKVKYGRCTVSIPFSHEVGQIESPSWWRFEFSESPDKHVMYRGGKLFDKATFFKEMQSTEGKKALLFVHGYNVSFVDAAKRTAQIAYDIDFPGVPIFYSWPSQASLSGYMKDSQNIEFAEPNIKQFIIDLIVKMPEHDLYLVAHSMGNRGVTKALSSIFKEKPEYAQRVKEIILTAPDIDAEIFKRDIAPNLIMHGNSVTLYASSTDKALVASKKINGYQRAGDAGKNIVIVEGIETIDATDVSTGFLGHSYYGETRSVLNDIDILIDNGLKAGKRSGLLKKITGTGAYWKFKR